MFSDRIFPSKIYINGTFLNTPDNLSYSRVNFSGYVGAYERDTYWETIGYSNTTTSFPTKTAITTYNNLLSKYSNNTCTSNFVGVGGFYPTITYKGFITVENYIVNMVNLTPGPIINTDPSIDYFSNNNYTTKRKYSSLSAASFYSVHFIEKQSLPIIIDIRLLPLPDNYMIIYMYTDTLSSEYITTPYFTMPSYFRYLYYSELKSTMNINIHKAQFNLGINSPPYALTFDSGFWYEHDSSANLDFFN